MTRTAGSKGEKTLSALREAGLRRLSQQGFSGMTLRELAGDVGIQAGSLYNYFQNKQDFLYQVLLTVMEDLSEELNGKLKGAETPRKAMLAYVDCHVSFHSSRKQEVVISTMELRSLNKENYQKIVTLRDRYEGQFRHILEWGNQEQVWKVSDPQVATKLILGMMTSVGTWYKAGGRYQISDLVLIYQEMIDNLLRNEVGSQTMNSMIDYGERHETNAKNRPL
ncbi:TetR/AcrR family transcriptional regulator [Sneathiella aquimaris]|uniref:TetR/AcrR family transcriptional regulator n=1 Tax=Sneathiella aquimaris TaxID=2599305 RepID=UPI00146AE06E|nr:TetR/AcrR family transcriptional regulator [Sneathiella aquimaris]